MKTQTDNNVHEPEQEPVGFVVDLYNGANTPSLPPTAMVAWLNDNPKIGQILYTTPPQRKPLSDEIYRLRKALVYVAHALHATPQYMLAKGITLLDNDAVRVSIDGWVVEASNKTIEAAHGIKETT